MSEKNMNDVAQSGVSGLHEAAQSGIGHAGQPAGESARTLVLACNVAGVACEVSFRQSDTPRFFADYLTDPRAAEYRQLLGPVRVPYRQDLVDACLKEFPENGPAYAEWSAAYTEISNEMPRYNRFVFHGAAVEFNGKAYLFTAPSGTGKSTHIALWRSYLGERVDIVNGDKPIIRVEDDAVYACGSPWSGKEQWQRPVQVPLGGVCFLRRGVENTIRRVRPDECINAIMNCIFIPAQDSALAGRALELLDQVLTRVPLYELHCDMSRDAVRTSFEAMTGKSFDDYTLPDEPETPVATRQKTSDAADPTDVQRAADAAGAGDAASPANTADDTANVSETMSAIAATDATENEAAK